MCIRHGSFGLCFFRLSNFKRYVYKRNRICWIYRDLELSLRIKPRRRLVQEKPDQLAVPDTPNRNWSMDFMSDRLCDSSVFNLFVVLDDFKREVLVIVVDFYPSLEGVIRSLKRIIEWREKPDSIRFDNVLLDEENILYDKISLSICLSKCFEDSYSNRFRHQELASSIANTGSVNQRPNRS